MQRHCYEKHLQSVKQVVRSKKSRDFQLLSLKRIIMCVAILSYIKDGGPSFQTQNVAERLVFQRPKWIGYKEKTSLHIYLLEVHENFRTRREKTSREFNQLKLPCPKFKRGRQTANVTAGVWSRDSQKFAVTRIQKKTWI